MGKVVEYGGVCFESSWPSRPALAENGNIDQSHVTCVFCTETSVNVYIEHTSVTFMERESSVESEKQY
jgi:hypothetical protein